MISTSDFYQCYPAEQQSLQTKKLYIKQNEPSYIMAEDQQRVFKDCKADDTKKKVDCLGQLPYKHPKGQYVQPKEQLYGLYFSEVLKKKMYRSHDECLNECRHFAWCKFVITECQKKVSSSGCTLGTCYLFDVNEAQYNTSVRLTRTKYYITRFRDGQNKESEAAGFLEMVPAEQVKGFRGFMVKVYGTPELIANYTEAHGNYWHQLKPGAKGEGRLFAADHSIYGTQNWFDPKREMWDPENYYLFKD